MHTPRIKFFIPILLFILANIFFSFGCGSEQTSNQNSQNSVAKNPQESSQIKASDSIENLLELVRLPVIPEEVVWREDTSISPKKLVAVLKFEPEELSNFTAIVEKNKLSDSIEVGVESWFPQELTAQSQLSGEGLIKGTPYAANEFYNIPYGSGRITRIQGTDFFVLELTASN